MFPPHLSFKPGLAVLWLITAMARAVSGEIVREYRHDAPLADDPFLQPIGRQIRSSDPLTAVGFDVAGNLWAGTATGIGRLEGTNWVSQATPAIRRLVSVGGALWAISAAGLHRLDGDRWPQIGTEAITDLCGHRGELVAATAQQLFQVQNGRLVPLGPTNTPFAVTRVVSHADSLFVVGASRLAPFLRGRFGTPDVYGFDADTAWDWGGLPATPIRDALSWGNRLLLGTERGVGVLRGMSLTTWRGDDGLPYEDITCLSRGFTNDVWLGTTRGAIRYCDGNWDYFAGERWLPAERVNALAVNGREVAIATDQGVARLRFETYTLAKQAAYYERFLEGWGQKRLGLTHKLEWDEGRKEFVREVGDNDGGYSVAYLAAQCYRYAVTHEAAARVEATNTFHSLRWLEAITGIPGFPARAVWARGELGHQSQQGSGGYPAEWHAAADPRFEWKGDTSSDELCGHFYGVSLFLDLVAEGNEVRQAKTHLVRIADHLMTNRWRLLDVDRQPTRWGRWDPEYLQTDEGRYDRGLQAVELLSFIRTAAAVSGQARFETGYQELVKLGYPDFTLRLRNTAPPESVLHFEDELGFWAYWNLLRLEPDPELRAVYRRSLERSYEVVRVEQQPWLNFVYAALTGETGEIAAAVRQLRAWPLDLRLWTYQNSHRSDQKTPPGYGVFKAGAGAPGGLRPYVAREREPARGDAWMMQADGGNGGRDVVEPGQWLLAYWMGRYHRFIAAPTVTEPSKLIVTRSEVLAGGARPYVGPDRPALP